MSSGAFVKTAYAKQTGETLPKTGWKTLPNISNGLPLPQSLQTVKCCQVHAWQKQVW